MPLVIKTYNKRVWQGKRDLELVPWWKIYHYQTYFNQLISLCINYTVIDHNQLLLFLRDDPKSPPVFVASNQAEKTCEFTVLGENLFAAVR